MDLFLTICLFSKKTKIVLETSVYHVQMKEFDIELFLSLYYCFQVVSQCLFFSSIALIYKQMCWNFVGFTYTLFNT